MSTQFYIVIHFLLCRDRIVWAICQVYGCVIFSISHFHRTNADIRMGRGSAQCGQMRTGGVKNGRFLRTSFMDGPIRRRSVLLSYFSFFDYLIIVCFRAVSVVHNKDAYINLLHDRVQNWAHILRVDRFFIRSFKSVINLCTCRVFHFVACFVYALCTCCCGVITHLSPVNGVHVLRPPAARRCCRWWRASWREFSDATPPWPRYENETHGNWRGFASPYNRLYGGGRIIITVAHSLRFQHSLNPFVMRGFMTTWFRSCSNYHCFGGNRGIARTPKRRSGKIGVRWKRL